MMNASVGLYTPVQFRQLQSHKNTKNTYTESLICIHHVQHHGIPEYFLNKCKFIQNQPRNLHA
jgi:hypothetical protein